MVSGATALVPELALRTRICAAGWYETVNPHYEYEVAASVTPWLVPQRVWTREQITDWRNGELVQGKVRIARCYDDRPGLECWCYRIMRYDIDTRTWEWASPGRKRVPFFDRLSAAKSALFSGERRDWWTT